MGRFELWFQPSNGEVVGVDAIATDAVTLKPAVVFTSVFSGQTWVMDMDQFLEQFERHGGTLEKVEKTLDSDSMR